MKVTITVEDRITRLNQALRSGVARETPEKQAELEAELHFLRELSRQGAGGAPLAAPFQSGHSWALPGCAGFYETEGKAHLRSIQLAAQAMGMEIPKGTYMKVADRITTIEQALHSGTVRLSLEKQDALGKELQMLKRLNQKAGGEVALPDIYQAGRVWLLDGHEGFFSEEFDARLGSIQVAAQAAGVDIHNANLDEPAARLMPGALAEVLRDLAATGAGARYAKHLTESAKQLDCLQLIADEMRDQKSPADAFDNISSYLSTVDLYQLSLDDPSYDDPGM